VDLAARPGPLKQYARLRLAELQNRLGKEADAVTLYSDILRSSPSGEVKNIAMAGKADNLLALGAKDKAAIAQALEVYQQLAIEPGLSVTLLHRALYQQGHCLELLERPEEALAAYFQVVQSGSASPQEYFWFYKAGFDACRLSEKREQWKSAIAIYQKMAAIDGPRAAEAKARLDKLRLEHFIWDK
jgi:tetratricopeptide (TPR) repeat protein